MDKKIKICLTCSAGGHFQQMRLAIDNLSREKYEYYWLMHKSKHLTSFFKDKRLITVTNTDPKCKWTYLVNAVQSLWYLMKEKPQVIISTGAGVSFPTIFFGKFFLACKVIYICSAANVTEPSRTPYQAYKYSDLFLVQWPEMLEIFLNAIYVGVL